MKFSKLIKIGLPIIVMYACNSGTLETENSENRYTDTIEAHIIEYKLIDSLFDDTLKIIPSNTSLCNVFQIWDKGILISQHALNKNNEWKSINYFSKAIGKEGSAVGYFDEDSAYYWPYKKDVYSFFNKMKRVKFDKKDGDSIDISFFNIPMHIFILYTDDSAYTCREELIGQWRNTFRFRQPKREKDTSGFYLDLKAYSVWSDKIYFRK